MAEQQRAQGGEADTVALEACNLGGPVQCAKSPAERVLDADKATPDDWVPRSPELIRLTGRHPLNCEPALDALLARAWPLTPPSLLYVRNHGRVPRLDAQTHRLLLRVPSAGGPCDRELSMAELREMPSRRVAVTLACAGLRRKEVAMMAPVDGFNWGAASLGTCVWTGVPLADLLRAAGVTEPSNAAQFVCFTGAPGEVPLGDDGAYGTSIPLSVALDPAADVLLAYEHNGEALTPDHGAPLRVIVPGYIGGRSVKWLASVEVTAQPSRNHYHTHDNIILPPDVDHARADAESWWGREEYLFDEFNVNSAIAAPAHDERVALAAPGGGPQPLTLQGWAYSGGGRGVTRVELTFDGGASWHLAALSPWERGTRHGRHWCAVAWSYDVADARQLLLCDEVAVRAHDAANNTQPEHITWSLKGMGNNAWYRVRVHKERCAAAPGGVALRFEAPVQPDGLKGGWMGSTPGGYVPPRPPLSELVLEAPGTPKQQAEHATPGGERKSSTRRVSRAELAQHAEESDCWVAIAGKVYNATAFLKDHPGGAFPITSNAGRDATDEFESIHSPHAWRMLDDLLVGELEPPGEGDEQPGEAAKDETHPWVTLPPAELRQPRAHFAGDEHMALNPHKRLPFTLMERIEVNHDTHIFRFALPSAEHVLGLPPGTHVFLSANIKDHRVVRPYTPITPGGTKGHFDLLIKVYFPTAERPGGLMSTYLDALRPGAQLHVRGPLGHIEYVGRGLFFVQDAEVRAADVGFVAGGTGITPVYQVLQAAAADADDTTRMSLIYCNKTPADILLRAELDALAATRPDRFRVWYVVDQDDAADAPWEHSTGLLSAVILSAHLPPASALPALFLCGPPGLERAARKMLKHVGHDESRVADF